MSSHYQKAHFLLSVAEPKQLPPDLGCEVAIVGRSNAGKSSILNKIAKQKQLARVSKTPGRTQLLNVFLLENEMHRLVDLPGYGFAKAPVSAKARWQKTVDTYIRSRESLKGIILVMDIRHPLKELDFKLLEYVSQLHLPVHILLNKADKLSRGAAASTLHEVRKELVDYAGITVQIFSALKGTGLKELYSILNEWYGYKKESPSEPSLQ